MSTLLFFLPRERSVPVQNGQELIDAGITYVDALDGVTSNFTISGPDGAGAIASLKLPDGTEVPPPVYNKDEQVWRRHPSGRYWVGYVKTKPPTPDTLRRRKSLDGKRVQLNGGGEWTVPICIPDLVGSGVGSTLPRQYDLDDSGKVIATVRDDYASIAERCFNVFERYTGEVKWPTDEVEREAIFNSDLELACELISLNYRVSRLEVLGLLRLLGNEEARRLLRVAIEADAIDAAVADMAKKEVAPGVSATTSGESDSPPAAGASANTGSATSS